MFEEDEKPAAIRFAQKYAHTHPALVKKENMQRFVGIKGDVLDEPLFHWTEYDQMPSPEPELDEKTEKDWIEKSDKIVKELGLTAKHGLDQGGYRIAISYVEYADDNDRVLTKEEQAAVKCKWENRFAIGTHGIEPTEEQEEEEKHEEKDKVSSPIKGKRQRV